MTQERVTGELGVGIIGCGNISTTYFTLSPLFKGIKVIACADINPAAAEIRAAEFGVEAQTIEALLANPHIDIVVNLTIPDAHFPVSKMILEAGKHVYSEKPLVLSLEQGEELRGIATASNLKVGCAPDTFLGGAHQLARDYIDQGKIGRRHLRNLPRHEPGYGNVASEPGFLLLARRRPDPRSRPLLHCRSCQPDRPGQACVAALTSMANASRTITSEPRKGEVIPVETPTNIHALLEFQNGATVTLSASWDVWSHNHANMELYGTEGSLFVPDPNFFGGTVSASGRDKDIQPLETWDHPFSVPNQEHKQGMMANYRTAGLADMALAILDGRGRALLAGACIARRRCHGFDPEIGRKKAGSSN